MQIIRAMPKKERESEEEREREREGIERTRGNERINVIESITRIRAAVPLKYAIKNVSVTRK